MKEKLQGKKAGIVFLSALIAVSLAELLFRTIVLGEMILMTKNLGEQVATLALAVTILVLTFTGKERACYILYGAWIGYFIFDKIFDLPGIIISLIANIKYQEGFITIAAMALRLVSMGCIVAIGALLVEYMIDGTIFNKAFNVLCIAAILSLAAYEVFAVVGMIKGGTIYALALFNAFAQILMIFLFICFAYDSAKKQLKKTDLTDNK